MINSDLYYIYHSIEPIIKDYKNLKTIDDKKTYIKVFFKILQIFSEIMMNDEAFERHHSERVSCHNIFRICEVFFMWNKDFDYEEFCKKQIEKTEGK